MIAALAVRAAAALLAVGSPPAWAVPTEVGVWPLDQTRVVGSFSPPAKDWLAGHRGVDLAASVGQPVRSMVAGQVVFAGLVAGKPVVSVALPDGRRVTYEPVRAQVAVGDSVSAGELLGVVAAAGGHCAVACLHVGLRTPTGYADPLSLLGRRPAVLKPL